MKKILSMRQWNWQFSAAMIGLTLVIAIALVKPIGVSSQYVILDAILWDLVEPDLIKKSDGLMVTENEYSSISAYLNRNDGAYAKAAGQRISYGLVFALAMVFGGFFAHSLTKYKSWREKSAPQEKANALDKRSARRYLMAFIGGFLSLIGAGLAGGCTSGHMMSGMMQTSLSAYLFTIAAFAVGIPTAKILHGKRSTQDTR